uniref:ABC transporter ATP-binding protein n=1 Tax=Ignisphaera aggregans TaxID=334771 RepID=A0A7C5TFM2_9CREN
MDIDLNNYLLYVDKVTKLFGYGLLGLRKFKALDEVTISLPSQEPKLFVLIGETGSGKTTLLRIILRMIAPDMGSVYYKGKNVFDMKSSDVKWYRKEVQAIFQDPYETFSPLRTIDSYLFDVSKYLLSINRKEAETLIDETLRFVGLSLDRVKGKRIREFSGGELQRISIARAILSKPGLLLADEPVSMLDASLRVNILNIFKEIKEKLKLSIIYVTHDLVTAYYVGDEMGVLYRGVLVESGPMEHIYKDPLHPYTQLLMNSILEPDIDIKNRIKPVKLSSIEIKEFLAPGCRFASRCPYAMPKCAKEVPPSIIVDGKRIVRCWLHVK